MSRRALVPALAGVVVLAGLATSPAVGKERPLLKGGSTVTLPVPYPSGGTGLPGNGCQEGPDDLSRHVERVKIPKAGTLVVELTNFQVDWDLILLDDKNRVVQESAGDSAATKEKLTYKKGKPGQTVQIVVCNWSGGPQGTYAWTFTPAPAKK